MSERTPYEITVTRRKRTHVEHKPTAMQRARKGAAALSRLARWLLAWLRALLPTTRDL